jgi:hypothetical protein
MLYELCVWIVIGLVLYGVAKFAWFAFNVWAYNEHQKAQRDD